MKKMVLTLILFASFFAFAQSEQTGNLVGTITDDSKNPVPGVTISLESEAMIGNRVIVSNMNGNFKAALLPPGTYTLTITMPGFQTVKQQVVVSIGGTTRANGILQPGTLEEVISVVASSEAALEAEGVSVNFDSEKVDVLPLTNRGMQGVLVNAPGVSVGNTGDYQIAGSQPVDNTFLLNGANISSPYYGQDQAVYVQEAIADTRVSVTGISARYGRFTGGVVNAITKSGSNTFEGSLRAELTNDAWDAHNPFRTGAATDDVQKNYQVTLGGPVLKDHVWFFLATRILPSSSTTGETYLGETFSSAQTDNMYEGKLTWAISPDHKVSLDILSRDQTVNNYQSFFQSASLRVPESGYRTDERLIYALNYTGVLTDSLFLDVTATKMDNEIGGGGDPNQGTPVLDGRTFTLANNMWWDQSDIDKRNNETFAADLNYYLDTTSGLHDMHFGFQYVNSITGGLNRQSPTGTNILFGYDRGASSSNRRSSISYDANNNPLLNIYGDSDVSLWVADPFPEGDAENKQMSIYAEDEWTMNNNWKVQLGFRVDQFEGGSPIIAESFKFTDISPRLTVTYDVHGDGDLKLIGTYAKYCGRINDNISNAATGVGNAPGKTYWYVGDQDFVGINMDEFRSSLTDPLYNPANWQLIGANDLSVNLLDKNLKAPYSIEYTLGVKKAFDNNAFIEAQLVTRDYTRMYETFTGGYGQTTFEDGSELDVVLTSNYNHERTYNAILLTTGIHGNSWSAGGNLTLSELKGNYEGDGNGTPGATSQFGSYAEVQDLTYSYPSGYLSGDVPIRMRAYANYDLVLGSYGNLALGAIARYTSGSPYSHTFDMNSAYIDENGNGVDDTNEYLGYVDYASTDWIWYANGQRGQFRYPSNYDIDFSFTYSLKFWRIEWYVKGDIINALNRKVLTSWNTQTVGTGTYYNVDGNLNTTAPAIMELDSAYGSPEEVDDYSSVRRYQIASGFRF